MPKNSSPPAIEVVKNTGEITVDVESTTNDVYERQMEDESESDYMSNSKTIDYTDSRPKSTNRTNIKREGSESTEVEEYEEASDSNESKPYKSSFLLSKIATAQMLETDEVKLNKCLKYS